MSTKPQGIIIIVVVIHLTNTVGYAFILFCFIFILFYQITFFMFLLFYVVTVFTT